ncbi:MAG: TetR family transcriptional regulator [Rhodospirillales bacterium]|nr:TetR family transcriptional regulator [Rhodospirillales bacterium]
MPKKTTGNIRKKIVDAALSLAAEKGWEAVNMRDIADQTGLKLHELYEYVEDRFDILAAYGRIIDRTVMESCGEKPADTSPRDHLFDLLMERFDILNENRDAVCSVLSSFRCDPKQAVIGLPHLGKSMTRMLEAANINTAGFRGALKVTGLCALYLKTLRVWMRDDSPDMAKTMAELDKNLEKAEQWSLSFRITP